MNGLRRLLRRCHEAAEVLLILGSRVIVEGSKKLSEDESSELRLMTMSQLVTDIKGERLMLKVFLHFTVEVCFSLLEVLPLYCP